MVQGERPPVPLYDDYRTVAAINFNDLSNWSNELLAAGYVPVGGIAVAFYKDTSPLFLQAFAKPR